MCESEITVALKELIDSNARLQLVNKVLKSIELSLNNIEITALDLDKIAPSLHYIYTLQNSAIRSSVLRVCSLIETISPDSITEKYYFDYLIASSICQKPPDPIPKVDEEKVAAFSYVSILLKYRRSLPTSILRALVSLYNVPIVAWSGPFKKLISSILGEASLTCSNVSEVPEIAQIFVDILVSTGSNLISSLLTYSIENKLSLVRENRFLSPLLSPFAQLEPSEKLSNARKALSSFLRTWTGFLYYGVQSGAISDLIRCLPHETDAVITIFRDLLKLSGTIEAVTDGYSGLFLSILLKLDLIEKLNQLASTKTSAALFLNELLPFTNHQGLKSNDIIANKRAITNIASVNVSNALLFDLAQTMCHEKQVTSINNFTLDPDPKLWEWTQILILLTVVLPHNESEANSPSARNFYKILFNYYSGPFLTQDQDSKDSVKDFFSRNQSTAMVEPLFALIHLLMNKSWGSQIIESSVSMKKAMLQVLNTLCENVVIDADSPQWALFRSVTTLMSEGNGISILSHWGFHDILTILGCKCTNPTLCENILETMKLYPEADLSIPIFLQFLSSPIAEVHKIAINDLRRKRTTTPNFLLCGLRGLIMPHVKDLCATNSEQKLPIALNLLGEIISTDDQSLLTVATDKQLHEMLSQSEHFIYSMLLSKEEGLQYCPSIDNEIEWWMKEDGGNFLYLTVFDRAVESTFSGTLESTAEREPSIFDHNGLAPIPPHLFGQLSRTKVGLEKLTKVVPSLVEQLQSENSSNEEKRAAMFALAHFASVPATSSVIEEHDIAEKMINAAVKSSSYVLKGTLITVLSLFTQTSYFSSVIQRHNWQLYVFGNHHCVIPCQPDCLFNESEAQIELNTSQGKLPKKGTENNIYLQMRDVEMKLSRHQEVIVLLKQLANALLVKTARQKLAEIFHTPKKDIELALYAHKLMSNFAFSADSRQFIYFLFRTVPLMDSVDFNASPKTMATVYAKLNQLEKDKNALTTAFKDIHIPLKSPSQMHELAKFPFPEAYMSDTDFQKTTNMSKQDFYQLGEEQQASIRQKIVSTSS